MRRRWGAGTAAERRAGTGGDSPSQAGRDGNRRCPLVTPQAAGEAPEQRRSVASGPPSRGPVAEGGSRCAGGRWVPAYLYVPAQRPGWGRARNRGPSDGAWRALPVKLPERSPAMRTRASADGLRRRFRKKNVPGTAIARSEILLSASTSTDPVFNTPPLCICFRPGPEGPDAERLFPPAPKGMGRERLFSSGSSGPG